MSQNSEVSEVEVVYHLRDRNQELVDSWKKMFADYPDSVKVSHGDIFTEAPAVDAIVSPANSFGFMDGGIDFVYTKHFGIQMQNRLQKVIRDKYRGEILVGQAAIIPAYEESHESDDKKDWSKFNEGVPIKYLVSAPTMRVPLTVSNTPNAYLAFRAVILAVEEHNKNHEKDPIRSVLVPGLGTAVGRMPKFRCAWQMLQAYETFVKGKHTSRVAPDDLGECWNDHDTMCEFIDDE